MELPPCNGWPGNRVTRSIFNLRWWVVSLLFVSTIINYVDRQTFSILAHEIQQSLHITDVGYAGVVQLFLASYTLAYLLTGRVTDRLGSKLGMTVFIVWWSIADVLTAFAGSMYSLGMYRFLLGVGEPGNWTVQAKAISEWFPPYERGLAYGICTAGATAGATVAVPLVAFLGVGLGWRAAFVITGSLGLLWVIPWMWLFRFSRDSHPVTDQAHDITAGHTGARAAYPEGETEGQRWKLMLADPNTWRFTLARLLTDPVWYFFLFWFPKYLIGEHSLSLIRVGELAWVVYLAAGAGTILGGWASGLLIKRGIPIVAARRRILLIAACIVPLSPLIAYAPAVILVLGVASFVVLAQLAWQVTLGTLIIDVYPQRFVATVFGIIATGGGLGGLLSTNAIGHLVTHFSYKPVYILMAFLHPCALFLLWKVRASSSPNGTEAK